MIARLAVALLTISSALAANPFAAKQTPSDPKSAYMTKLMKNAVPTKNSQLRKLDGAEVEVDITGYSLKFTKCQFVKAYDQDLADANAETVLATQRFVIFRLCPSSSCGSCNTGYGEYAIDMNDYLEYTVEYRQDEQTEMCETCEENCQYYGDDAADEEEEEAEEAEEEGEEEDGGERRLSYDMDCSTCVQACDKIENMEANYYIDATTFINCQQIQEEDEYYGKAALYAGPMCASQGSKIKIGVFTDEDCMYLDSSKDVEDYLADEDGNGFKVSHALLKTVYDESECIDCLADKEGDDDAAEDEVKDVCANLYASAGKCESIHGFVGISSDYYDAAANQVNNENLVCEFIDSLKSGTYSQDGEIVIGGSKMYTNGGTSTTGGQKFALTFFILGTVGLAVYAAMLHTQLTKGGKADLSSQGGAMA
mmetsp:Transcript_14679/g.18595  ORF Transcript_14679/g.18595 Transcript_14679/m.18595 type:complete len:425 (+) Transcript_14679:206-1480(+)